MGSTSVFFAPAGVTSHADTDADADVDADAGADADTPAG